MRNTWIFQLLEPLSLAQVEKINTETATFLNSWKAHGTPVPGSAEIRYNRFVVLKSQEGTASGCSIDAMTREVGRILNEAGAKSAESGLIFYRDGGEIKTVDFREVEKLIAGGMLHADTIIFENTLGHTNDLSRWELPLKETWLARFLTVLS